MVVAHLGLREIIADFGAIMWAGWSERGPKALDRINCWILMLSSFCVLLNRITPVQSVARPPGLLRTATARGLGCPLGGGDALPGRQCVGRAATTRHDGAPIRGRRTRLPHRRANARSVTATGCRLLPSSR